MKPIRTLFTGTLLIGACTLTAQQQGEEVLITTGPKAGAVIRITGRTALPTQSAPPGGWIASLTQGGQQTNMPVQLQTWRLDCVRSSLGHTEHLACYEFRVSAPGPSAFVWSCLAPDFPHPHGFKLFTTPGGQTYASYVGDGMYLFHIVAPRDPHASETDFWNRVPHPDGMPVLPLGLLTETMGRTNLLGLGPQTWNLTVDAAKGKEGRVEVTLHGRSASPQYAFVLEAGKWSFLSRDGAQ